MPQESIADGHERDEWRIADTRSGRFEVTRDGRVRNRHNEREIQLNISPTGYYQFATKQGRKSRSACYKVHRLVAFAWLGPQPSARHVVNHKDGNKLNNDVSNLEWVTPGENARHACRLGLMKPRLGMLQPMAKLDDDKVRFIRRVYRPHDARFGARGLSARFGVHHSIISRVANGHAWAHVTDEP